MQIKKNSSTGTIISAFKNNNIIGFEKAVYKITDTITLYDDCVIDLNGATLRRHCSVPVFMTSCTNKTKGYDGARNIVVKNGTIEGMNDCGYGSSNLVALFHASNIRFENVTFLDAVGSHCIDIVGCQNVTIDRCSFYGYKSFGHDFRESIQIDFAYYGGLPYFASNSATYDMTKCNNITVSNCKFGRSATYPAQYTAIGTHEQANDKTWHTNINVIGNQAYGNGVSSGNGFFLRVMNFQNVTVRDNTVSNYGRFVVCTMPSVLRNKDSSTVEPKNVLTVRNLIVENNNVLSNGFRYAAYAVYIEDTYGNAKDIVISGFNKDLPKNAVYVKAKNVEIGA